MNTFPADWLRRREPYDHAARSDTLVRRLGEALTGTVTVLELACGLGSGLRYVAPRLDRAGVRQRWILVDHDPALLEAAPQALAAWAAEIGLPVTARADGLSLGPRLEVTFARVDLRDPAPWPDADVVTTQALLDLVDEGFLADLDRRLGDRPLLAALSVDGRLAWHPSDADDLVVHGRFRAHQRTDRGFGASPGVLAAPWLASRLRARGMRVWLEEADWRIGAADRAMLGEMVDGIAHAAAEMADDAGPISASRVEAWRVRRREAPGALVVGHLDLLALPGGAP